MAPNTQGQWGPVQTNALPRQTVTDVLGHSMYDERDLFVIHAVLMHTNKVLMFSGLTEHLNYPAAAYVLNLADGQLHRRDFPPQMDLFCCHYVQVADGRILVVGGSQLDLPTSATTADYRGSNGGKYIAMFDPDHGAHGDWVIPMPGTPALQDGRWYPTAVHLGDGRVLVFSGRTEIGGAASVPPQGPAGIARGIARFVEVLSPPNYTSTRLGGSNSQMLPIYPGLHLLPDGRVMFTHTNWGQEINEPPTLALTVGTSSAGPTGTWDDFGSAPGAQPSRPRREEGMSVLLPLRPPNYEARIMVVGGGRAVNASGVPIQFTTGGGNDAFARQADPADASSFEIMTVPAGGTPTWANGTLNRPRINGHCVLLPDGRVLILGGHNSFKWNASASRVGDPTPLTTPSLEVELYTPPSGAATTPLTTPTLGVALEDGRMYHSVAILLPDGRVMVAGGAEPNYNEEPMGHAYPGDWPSDRKYTPGPAPPTRRVNGDPYNVRNRKSRQVYSPPYFFNGPRPTIASITRGGVRITQIEYGQQFVISSPEAAQIATVALMRPGAPTHHTDTEQRYVELEKTIAGNDITATIPPASRSSVLPPGWYMVWIVTGGSPPLPCQRASWLKVAHPPPAPPPPPPPPPPTGTGTGTGGTPGPGTAANGSCPVLVLAAGTALMPGVMHLRAMRAEIANGSAAGRAFVRLVMGAYWRPAPLLASHIARRPRLRAALREAFLRPALGAARLADAVAGAVPTRRARQRLLMALLALEGAAAVALAPVWLGRAALHVVRHRSEASDAR